MAHGVDEVSKLLMVPTIQKARSSAIARRLSRMPFHVMSLSLLFAMSCLVKGECRGWFLKRGNRACSARSACSHEPGTVPRALLALHRILVLW